MIGVPVTYRKNRFLLLVGGGVAASLVGLWICISTVMKWYSGAVIADETGTAPAPLTDDLLGMLSGLTLIPTGLAVATVALVQLLPAKDHSARSSGPGDYGAMKWALASHIAGIFGAVPVLVIYLHCRRIGGIAVEQAREALNFQITLLIGVFLSVTVLPLYGLFLVWVSGIALSITAALRLQRAADYRYPFTLRMVR